MEISTKLWTPLSPANTSIIEDLQETLKRAIEDIKHDSGSESILTSFNVAGAGYIFREDKWFIEIDTNINPHYECILIPMDELTMSDFSSSEPEDLKKAKWYSSDIEELENIIYNMENFIPMLEAKMTKSKQVLIFASDKIKSLREEK